MVTTTPPTDSTLVACEVCMRQVPASEATVPEATDYFVHFCGLECYEKWKQQAEAPQPPSKKP